MKIEIGFRNQNKKGEWFEVIRKNEKGNYVVRFDNGVERKSVPKYKILNGDISSNKPPEDLFVHLGQRFGKLVVIGLENPVRPELLCDCGNTCTTVRHNLINDLKTSCGCSPMKAWADAYWSQFNKFMENWDPTTHRKDTKKLPLFKYRRCSTDIVGVNGFTYVDADFYEYWKQFPFIKAGQGYACLASNAYIYDKIVGFSRRLKYKYKLHHLVRGHTSFGEYVVDHINGCKLDNRFLNLRTATIQQNGQNSRKMNTKETSSIYKGVCFVPSKPKLKSGKWAPWRAAVTWNYGKNKKVRYCETEVEAALKYNELATEVFGEFARLNIVE